MSHAVVDAYARHVNPAFVKLLGFFGYGRVFVKAEDVWVFDDEGRRYLDLLAGFGAVNLGHNHPRIRARLAAYLDSQPLNLVHVGPSAPMAELASRLAVLAGEPLEVALFSSSGAEAVEAALKLARAATGRTGLLSSREGFHGTSLGTLSILAVPRMTAPFQPLLPGCELVPYGDVQALEAALATRRYAAFVVEPIAAEGGVLVPPPGYLRAASGLCRRSGTLFVLDEVQTGLGRTGRMFAFQEEATPPDVLVLGKALGGGVAPIGVTLTTREIQAAAFGSMDRFDLHGSTFAGNGLSCAAALEALSVLADEDLPSRSAARGRELLEALTASLAGHPFVREVRGRGLLVGVELGPAGASWLGRLSPALSQGLAELVLGQWVSVRLLEKGFLCQPASQRWNVLKVEPPLTISSSEVARAAAAIAEALDETRAVGPLLTDVARRLGEQALAGGAFR